MLNNYPNKSLRGTEIEINENNFIITPGLQKLFNDTTYDAGKSMNDTEKVVFRDILQKTGYYNRKRTEDRLSGRDRYNKIDFDNVIKILNLDTKLKGRGVEKIIIPSNIIDIYTRLQVLLGLRLSGHANTLTDASNLIDELYKRGDIQNEQQYRNALNKISIIYSYNNISNYSRDEYIQIFLYFFINKNLCDI